MKQFNDHGFFELNYKQELYSNMLFVREDTICETTYVTLKNVLTEEIMTFEKDKITTIKMVPNEHIYKDQLAEGDILSLY